MSKVNTAPVLQGDQVFSFPAPAKDQVQSQDAAPAKDVAPVTDEAPPAEAPAALNDQADFRLVIEEDPSGAFVYKTMDRRTGEVIQQFPREQLLRMKESEQYTAGSVVNARA